MTADFLLPPREDEATFSLTHLLLSDFQEEIEYQFEAFSHRVRTGQEYMSANWQSVANAATSPELNLPQQQEWVRVTTELCAATEWLRLHEKAAALILAGNAEDIDISHPAVQPLWQQFADQKKPQWMAQWKALCELSGWTEETTSAEQDFPESLSSTVEPEPAGVNQSPFYDLPNHELNERYPDREEDEPFEDGYDDEEGEADEKYASATPSDASPNITQSSLVEVPEKPIPTFPLAQFVAQHLHPILHRFIRRICTRFSFNINEISVVAPSSQAWRVLKNEELGAPLPDDDLETQTALMPIRAQKALLEVFSWAERSGIQDELKIEDEFLDAFLPSYALDIHDFDWRSNGASRIVAGEIEYEGGSEMPNDGFSIQTESRIQRPFDRD